MPLVLLQTVGDNQEASVLRTLLDAHGIRCVIQGEQHRAMLGMLGSYIELRVLVEAEDLDRARRVLSEAEEAGPLAPDELEGTPGALRGAVCPVHEKDAEFVCGRCGTFLCEACNVSRVSPVCEECEARERTPDAGRAARRRLSALVVFLLLFGLPALALLIVELSRWVSR
jgi:hypothetical protein